MPIPGFIVALREKIGHDLLWLSGVSGVVLDDDRQRVLLTQRRDNLEWAVISGILEPAEQPIAAIEREILEETGVTALVDRLVSVVAEPEVKTMPNGDRCQFLDLTFRCRYATGQVRVADDENLAVAWFGLDDLPSLNHRNRHRIALALQAEAPVHLVR